MEDEKPNLRFRPIEDEDNQEETWASDKKEEEGSIEEIMKAEGRTFNPFWEKEAMALEAHQFELRRQSNREINY